jgi:hypothetical protein
MASPNDPRFRIPERLSEALEFRPKWWWDPIPPWILEDIRPEFKRELAQIHLELERAVLEAQMKSIERSMEVLQRMR